MSDTTHNSDKLHFQSIKVPLPRAEHVHLTRFYRSAETDTIGEPVFMLHTATEDGSTFFQGVEGGLAAYLARQGYDVYVADLRGRGDSWPKVNGHSQFGSHQFINEDIPAMLAKIASIRGPVPQIWVAHGWGGVLLSAYYARFGERAAPLSRQVFFGCRRQLLVNNIWRRLRFDFLWRRVSSLAVSLFGYMPARLLRLGGSDESASSFQNYLRWGLTSAWRDEVDDFDYAAAILQRSVPPSLYFAAAGDWVFGHREDVRRFMEQLGPHDARLIALSRRGGNLHNYSHRAMLSHRDCERDHFPQLLGWLQEYA